jgi:hypothetical protein
MTINNDILVIFNYFLGTLKGAHRSAQERTCRLVQACAVADKLWETTSVRVYVIL